MPKPAEHEVADLLEKTFWRIEELKDKNSTFLSEVRSTELLSHEIRDPLDTAYQSALKLAVALQTAHQQALEVPLPPRSPLHNQALSPWDGHDALSEIEELALRSRQLLKRIHHRRTRGGF